MSSREIWAWAALITRKESPLYKTNDVSPQNNMALRRVVSLYYKMNSSLFTSTETAICVGHGCDAKGLDADSPDMIYVVC